MVDWNKPLRKKNVKTRAVWHRADLNHDIYCHFVEFEDGTNDYYNNWGTALSSGEVDIQNYEENIITRWVNIYTNVKGEQVPGQINYLDEETAKRVNHYFGEYVRTVPVAIKISD